ncbi:4-hydroxythreonine-4-phosphate dehydrogenase [Sulfurimonas sp. HSL-1716]|uniref:4-hydroxythreonine-4-phosphate dehydrogenase n=1 Tax=Hydrocurvibacter sulfurireducens TaxID=3131937 RepID=UPI0031F88BCE
MKKIAISIGDINGVGLEIALKAHEEVSRLCHPVYCVDEKLLIEGAKLLNVKLPKELICRSVDLDINIEPSKVTRESGTYSYLSFLEAVKLCERGECDAVVTLPVHKEAWMKAGLKYKGHTDMLRDYFKRDAIMMLGCEKLYVPLFTEHIPLREVPSHIKKEKLTRFLLDLHKSIGGKRVAVLGLNPHAGDNGAIGDEEREIEQAIAQANGEIGDELFFGPVVPDVAFAPYFRDTVQYICAMYHDQGLAPLKALYFQESINVSLNLPIVRTSVDHGTAFDIAYKNKADTLSYINAVKAAIELSK